MAEERNYIGKGEKVAKEAREASKDAGMDTLEIEDTEPVKEIRDTRRSVDLETGKVDERVVPPSPTPRETPAPHSPTPTPTPTPAPSRPARTEAADPKPLVGSVIVSASEFEGKKKSFLNPDAEDNFWKTLEGKLKEALSGNTADEIGQNMAFAALTFLFDAIGNWAVHHRKEAKRLKKEYDEKTKAFDDVLKNTLIEKYGAVAEFAIKNGVNINTKEGREKLEKLKNNKEFLGLCAAFLSASLNREVTPSETQKLINGTEKSLSKGNLALNSQEVANALGTQAAQDNAAYWDKRAKNQKIKVENLSQFRSAMRTARQATANRGKTDVQLRKEVLER